MAPQEGMGREERLGPSVGLPPDDPALAAARGARWPMEATNPAGVADRTTPSRSVNVPFLSTPASTRMALSQ